MISELNIIRLILYNIKYRQKVIANLNKKMFHSQRCAEIFELVVDYNNQYNRYPVDNIKILLMNNNLKQPVEIVKEKIAIVECNVNDYDNIDLESYLNDTENWIKERKRGILTEEMVAMYNKKNSDFNYISEELKKIEAFTFKENEWLSCYDNEKMIERYLTDEKRVRFKNETLNQLFGGGLKLKTLSVIMAGTHVGKTRFMHSMACDIIRHNKSSVVLYISLEIERFDLSEFFDSNIFNKSVKEIEDLVRNDKNEYKEFKEDFENKNGELILIEWTPSSASPNRIRNLLDEMILKNKKPIAVFLDYIGILKPNEKFNNSFEKGDEASLEIRSIAQDYDIPFVSAVQPRREGFDKNLSGHGAEVTDVGGSKAIPDNCDFFANIVQTDQMKQINRQILYIKKNRHYPNFKPILLQTYDLIYKVDVVGLYSKDENINPEEEVREMTGQNKEIAGEVDFDSIY